MNMGQEDTKIRQLFERLRVENEADVPEFHQLLTRSGSKRGPGWALLRHRVALSALLMIVVLAPILYFVWRQEPASIEETQLAALSEWESPTDFLLENPNSSLWDSVPAIETDLADWSEGEEDGVQ